MRLPSSLQGTYLAVVLGVAALFAIYATGLLASIIVAGLVLLAGYIVYISVYRLNYRLTRGQLHRVNVRRRKGGKK